MAALVLFVRAAEAGIVISEALHQHSSDGVVTYGKGLDLGTIQSHWLSGFADTRGFEEHLRKAYVVLDNEVISEWEPNVVRIGTVVDFGFIAEEEYLALTFRLRRHINPLSGWSLPYSMKLGFEHRVRPLPQYPARDRPTAHCSNRILYVRETLGDDGA